MNMSRTNVRFKVTAPAVVVLAAVVNAAAGSAVLAEARVAPSPLPEGADLSWAVRGGATHSVKTTREFLAKKAAKNIDSLDQLSGAPVAVVLHATPTAVVLDRNIERAPLAFTHVRSSHQHSAP
jgi:hypothetical protein